MSYTFQACQVLQHLGVQGGVKLALETALFGSFLSFLHPPQPLSTALCPLPHGSSLLASLPASAIYISRLPHYFVLKYFAPTSSTFCARSARSLTVTSACATASCCACSFMAVLACLSALQNSRLGYVVNLLAAGVWLGAHLGETGGQLLRLQPHHKLGLLIGTVRRQMQACGASSLKIALASLSALQVNWCRHTLEMTPWCRW